MKVLQINVVCGTGSTGKIVVDLYKVLKKEGHDCKIAYGRRDVSNSIDSIKIGNKFDNYVHGLKTRLFDMHGFGSINATKIFLKELEKYNPDIIHLHNIHGYYINVELLFRYLKKIEKPVIWTLHDCWTFTGHCAYFDYIECNKWKTICFDCPQKKTYPASYFFDNSKFNFMKKKELFTSVDNLTIVTPSKWLCNMIKESFLSKYQVQVINNGINLELFKPTKSNFKTKYGLENKIMILGVANVWEKRKGLEYFIQLSKILDDKFKIFLVGIEDRYKHNIPQNIFTIKRTNNISELVEIYSSADVFLNPTLEDNFPTTNLESLACGTPVITFNTGGSSECISENCGFVVEKYDIDSIVEKIYEISISGKNIEACRKKSLEYDYKRQFEKYINLYKSRLI